MVMYPHKEMTQKMLDIGDVVHKEHMTMPGAEMTFHLLPFFALPLFLSLYVCLSLFCLSLPSVYLFNSLPVFKPPSNLRVLSLSLSLPLSPSLSLYLILF